MPTNFHRYLDKIISTRPEHFKSKSEKWLKKITTELLAEQHLPPEQRAINSTTYVSRFSNFSDAPSKITPLQLAMQKASPYSCLNQEQRDVLKEITTLYLEASDLTVEGEYGHSLIYAAMYPECGSEVIKGIIAKNPELVSTMSPDGSYPLNTAACYDKDAVCVELLLKEGKADPNTKSRSDGWTPLHQAVYSTNEKTVRLLLQYGADIDEKDKEGRKATELKYSDYHGLAERKSMSLTDQQYSELQIKVDAKKRQKAPIYLQIIELIEEFRAEKNSRSDIQSPIDAVAVDNDNKTVSNEQYISHLNNEHSSSTTPTDHLNKLMHLLDFQVSDHQLIKLRALNEEQLTTRFALFNTEHLSALLSRLQSLRLKREQLNQDSAWLAADDLIHAIEKAMIDHLIIPESAQIEEFKELCNDALAKAKSSELVNHRGWKEALQNIAIIILSCGILALPIISTRLCTGNWFFKSKTDSIEKVEELQETLNKIP